MRVLLGAIWRQIPVGGFRPHADSSDDETYVPWTAIMSVIVVLNICPC